jgi:glycerol uptake facilitator protein
MGATVAFPGVAQWQAVLNEVVITFFLMTVIMAMAIDERTPDQLAGLAIGFAVAMGILTTGNISGALFNPARTIGPYVASTVFLDDLGIWRQVWIYVIGPTAGAVVAAYYYDRMVLGDAYEAEPSSDELEEAEPT